MESKKQGGDENITATSAQETPDNVMKSPAEKFGVGGTTSMVSILTNDVLTDDQKINIMIEWFGLKEEAVINMFKNGKTGNE